MRAKLIKEFGGAGFSYSGATMATSRPGGVNRGGFGGAANLGGPNMMYTYEIKPLNRTLQPEASDLEEDEKISIGNDISGLELNKKDDKLHVGSVQDIIKSENGSLKYYIIIDPDTAQLMKIDPTTALLVSKLDGVDPLGVRLSKEEEELMNPGEKVVNNMNANENYNEEYRAKTVNEVFGFKKQQTYEYDDDDYGFELENAFKRIGIRNNVNQFSYDIKQNRPYIGINVNKNKYFFVIDKHNNVILDKINGKEIQKPLGNIKSTEFIDNLENILNKN